MTIGVGGDMRTHQKEQLNRAFDEMSEADRDSLLRTALSCAKRNGAKRASLRLVSSEPSVQSLQSSRLPQRSLG